MADNVYSTQPNTGTLWKTDDLGASGHVQYVKLVDGTDGGTGVIAGDATYGLDVDVTRLAGMYAEDAAHVSGNLGLMALAVRRDTLAASAGTDGDYSPVSVDADGRLYTSAKLYGSHYNDNASAVETTVIGVDRFAPCLLVMDFNHHHVHEGRMFLYEDNITLGSAATQDYLITTPDDVSEGHFAFSATSGGKVTVELYESADRTGTTSQTVINLNRRSSNTAAITVHKGQSGGTTDGTKIRAITVGSGKTLGGTAGTADEMPLKRNAKYILRITSGAASNDIYLNLNWYEHGTVALENRGY